MKTNILEYMDEAVQRFPEKEAFADDELTLTFAEFADRANRVGTMLLNEGAEKEPIIIFMKRSPLTLTAFFGTVAAGCYYVPIDVEMPRRRIELILETTKARFMITDESTSDTAKELEFTGEMLSYESIPEKTDEDALQKIRESALDVDPTYVLFTSGSTGVPKGVVGYHKGVIDYAETLTETLGFDETCVFGMQAPLYLDACMKEVFSTLKFGGKTWLIPGECFLFPTKLVEYLNDHKVNTICWVVSALTMISSFGTFDIVKPEYLKKIAFGSEVFPPAQFNLWKNTLPDADFFNLYGPTEATGMSCYYHADRFFDDNEVIPIGRPFKNTEIMLLDAEGNLVPDGKEGEICIRGTCLTKGYYRNPEKTDEVFTPNPLRPEYDDRIYHTGDLGYRKDGELFFASRKDHQIKHMGHRIELGEIEADAMRVDGVKMCACVFFRENEKIVFYYVGDIDKRELTKELKKRLPRYMVPNAIRQIDTMPLLPNGKLDRMKLKDMYTESKNNKNKETGA